LGPSEISLGTEAKIDGRTGRGTPLTSAGPPAATGTEAGWRAAWNRTSAGVLLLAADDRITWANGGAANVLGRDQLEGLPVQEVLPTLATDDASAAPPREHVAVTTDGSLRPVAVHVDPEDPLVPGRRLMLVIDVSALRASERELLLQNNLLQSAGMALFDAKTTAEEASRRKTQFLAYASHEIRTPLQAILGFAEQLDEGTLASDERAEAVRVIRRNGEHLLTVLSDVLDLARIEADRLEVRYTPCDLRQVVDEVVRLFAGAAREQGVAIAVEERTPLPATVGTDKTRLRQVLINLLGNAVRSARADQPGCDAPVRLTLAAEASPPRILVQVRDHGPGLPQQELQRMFEPFGQAAATADHRLGTGLGLAISRRLARLLGGDLTAESTIGEGTTVEFTFDPGPLEPETLWHRNRVPAAAPPAAENRLGKTYVLLAEDGRDNRLLLGTILKRAGIDVESVPDGAAALDAVAEAERAGRPFDAIVMDMQMPVMDGYEATARLRERGCAVPILALTADALADARQRCLDAGCDAYASKPIDRRALLQALRGLLDADVRGAARARTPVPLASPEQSG